LRRKTPLARLYPRTCGKAGSKNKGQYWAQPGRPTRRETKGKEGREGPKGEVSGWETYQIVGENKKTGKELQPQYFWVGEANAPKDLIKKKIMFRGRLRMGDEYELMKGLETGHAATRLKSNFPTPSSFLKKPLMGPRSV